MQGTRLLSKIFWVLGITALLCAKAHADTTNNVVPIPGVDYSQPTPVQTIVVDSNGNMSEKTYTYDPNQGGVVIINNNQVSGNNASLFFPLFMMGFMWAEGYWVGHNGAYWNGNHYTYVSNKNWNNNWNNYWHNNWNNKWQNYWNQHHNDKNWPYRNNKNWPDQPRGDRRENPSDRGGQGQRGQGRGGERERGGARH